MDVTKLIYYVHASRRRYLQAVGELPWEEVIKDRGASFSSIRDILIHSLDMEDRMINFVAIDKSQEWAQSVFETFTDLKSIEKHVNEVEGKVGVFLNELNQQELDREVSVPRRTGSPLVMKIEDLLVQVAIENIAHMGELIAIMWQIDKQPPFISWSSFLEQGK